MMGKRATEAAQVLIDELGLEGQLTPEQFLKEREELLDKMFPQAELLPGAGEEGSVPNACSYAHKCSTRVCVGDGWRACG